MTFRLVVVFFTGPSTVTRSSLRMLRRVAAFCRPLRPVLLLVLFPRSRRPVVGVLGLCRMWHGVPFARQRRPVARPPPPSPRTMQRLPGLMGMSSSSGGLGRGWGLGLGRVNSAPQILYPGVWYLLDAQ